MLMNMPLMSLSMSDILEIDVATIISPVLRNNFAKIHTNSELVLLMTLLFSRTLILVKIFH